MDDKGPLCRLDYDLEESYKKNPKICEYYLKQVYEQIYVFIYFYIETLCF